MGCTVAHGGISQQRRRFKHLVASLHRAVAKAPRLPPLLPINREGAMADQAKNTIGVGVRWQDIKDLRIHVDMLGADLTITALDTPDLPVSGQTRILTYVGLRKEQAEAVYRICQAQEQSWREKRRVPELENCAQSLAVFSSALPPAK